MSAFRSGDTSAMRALETIIEPGTVITMADEVSVTFEVGA